MNMIWNLRSAPELAALSGDELKLVVREAGDAKFVRKTSLLGLMLCGLCASAGSLIGDAFSIGIYGAGIGGAIGGLVYTQMRMRAILRFIRIRDAVLKPEQGLKPR